MTSNTITSEHQAYNPEATLGNREDAQHFDLSTLGTALPPNFRSPVNQQQQDGIGQAYSTPFYHPSAPQQYAGRWQPGYAPNQVARSHVSFGQQPIQTQMAPHVSALAGVSPHQFRTEHYGAENLSPRGPPFKPKQSGHALWVGNIPPFASIVELKDHFSTGATDDIDSLFLITRSNCAFVNYRTHEACVAAMSRFHNSRFQNNRVVCRLRRSGSTTDSDSKPTSATDRAPSATAEVDGEPSSPVIVGDASKRERGGSGVPDGPMVDGVADHEPTTDGAVDGISSKVPEKFFIVKSLTLQDLEASLRNGLWVTQSHNETKLNGAFKEADNVYLIFSANKSGEYFGYARMASTIQPKTVSQSGAAMNGADGAASHTPRSIPTQATATARRGRIIDDTARGTIFWEVDSSDDEGEDDMQHLRRTSSVGNARGGQFAIQWQSWNRVPFYMTQGLRNPWNANREVKIARDGTELDPRVGKRLLQLFHSAEPTAFGISPVQAMPQQQLWR